MPEQISIAIVTMDRSNILKKTLENIKSRGLIKNVIIIDGSKKDSTARACKQYDVEYRRQKSTGMTAARNEALEECDTKYISFLDDDVRLSDTWYETVTHEFNKDRDIVGVTGRVIKEKKDRREIEKYFRKYVLGKKGRQGKITNDGVIGGRFDFNDRQEVDHMPGCNMTYKTETLQEVGGFDEEFDRGHSYREETITSYRVSKKGRLIYNPDVSLTHLSIRENNKKGKYLYSNAYNTRLFLYKENIIDGYMNRSKYVTRTVLKNIAFLLKYRAKYRYYINGEIDSIRDVLRRDR